jgi:ABC-type amino acid transport substrate-binding protein
MRYLVPAMRRMPSRPGVLWGLALLCAAVAALAAEAVPRLPPVEILGVQPPRKAPPGVFDPLNDPRWQAGFRETFPSAIPEELKNVDALTRSRAMGRLVACADGWYYPFSVTAARTEPPGIDIELLNEIARRRGWRVQIVWTNTNSHGGLGRAFGGTIDHGYCDVFLGLVVTGEDDDVEKHKLAFTRPYLGMGFVLAVQGKAAAARRLEDLPALGARLGILMFSPMERYAKAHGIPHEIYFQNDRLIDAMLKNDVDACMIWSGALAKAKKEFEADFDMVPGFVPQADQRWNGAWAVKSSEADYKRFIDESIAELEAEGFVRRVVERYGMPYFPPF